MKVVVIPIIPILIALPIVILIVVWIVRMNVSRRG